MIKVGSRVKDTVTGFTGIAVSRTEYLNGCHRIAVQAEKFDKGKIPDAEYFDEMQLTVIKEAAVTGTNVKKVTKRKKTGGPRNDPPKRGM